MVEGWWRLAGFEPQVQEKRIRAYETVLDALDAGGGCAWGELYEEVPDWGRVAGDVTP